MSSTSPIPPLRIPVLRNGILSKLSPKAAMSLLKVNRSLQNKILYHGPFDDWCDEIAFYFHVGRYDKVTRYRVAFEKSNFEWELKDGRGKALLQRIRYCKRFKFAYNDWQKKEKRLNDVQEFAKSFQNLTEVGELMLDAEFWQVLHVFGEVPFVVLKKATIRPMEYRMKKEHIDGFIGKMLKNCEQISIEKPTFEILEAFRRTQIQELRVPRLCFKTLKMLLEWVFSYGQPSQNPNAVTYFETMHSINPYFELLSAFLQNNLNVTQSADESAIKKLWEHFSEGPRDFLRKPGTQLVQKGFFMKNLNGITHYLVLVEEEIPFDGGAYQPIQRVHICADSASFFKQ